MLQKLKDGKEIAYLSKKLVTIATDIKIEQNKEDFKLKKNQ